MLIRNLIKRWGLFVLLFIMLVLFFYFNLDRYLSFASLKEHRQLILSWSDQYYIQTILAFMAAYTMAVAISVPGAVFLTIAGGFLFGPIVGTAAVVVSATLGAFVVYIAIELALREWFAQKAAKWIKTMEEGFQNNPFSYLLFLRLVPVFPFWLVNIVPPLLGVKKRVFVLATFIGIIPGSFVYVMIGSGLGHIFDTNDTPNLSIILEPQVLLPLLALALLALVPIGYKSMQKGRKS